MSVEAWEEMSGAFVPCDINHLKRLAQSKNAFQNILNHVNTCISNAAVKNQTCVYVNLLQFVNDKGYDSWLFHEEMTFEDMYAAICSIYSKAGYNVVCVFNADVFTSYQSYEVCESLYGVDTIGISWGE